MKLYDFLDSGNGYKVRLLLHLLSRPFELVELDIMTGETRSEAFLAKNPNGRIPTLELDDGRCLPESNAILYYLAENTPYLPASPFERAQVLRWMFFEQYSHEPYIAVLRFWKKHLNKTRETEVGWAEREDKGYAALEVMERELADRQWLVGDAPSIADIALYAYTHVAGEGDYDLSPYPAIGRWLARVAALPGYVPITAR